MMMMAVIEIAVFITGNIVVAVAVLFGIMAIGTTCCGGCAIVFFFILLATTAAAADGGDQIPRHTEPATANRILAPTPTYLPSTRAYGELMITPLGPMLLPSEASAASVLRW